MKELELIAREVDKLRAAGKRGVLATVVDIQGSSYRLPGARMLIADTQWTAGSVSGGCLEGDVVLRAREVLKTGRPMVVTYDTTSDEDIVFGVGLGCRGIIHVLVEPIDAQGPDLIGFIRDCISRRETGVVASVVRVNNETAPLTGTRLVRSANGDTQSNVPDTALGAQITAHVARMTADDVSHMARFDSEHGPAQVFVEVIRPPLPLVIFGAGHDAIPVARLAKELGWHVTVVDHRPAYATRERFPCADAVIVATSPEIAQRVPLDRATVALVMTHNYLRDLEVLKLLLPSSVRYVGLLGPKRRAGELMEEFERQSIALTDAQRARFYAPVGLDLGAEGPEGVALAVLAEIQAVVAGRTPGHLRERKGSIHGLSAAQLRKAKATA